MNAEFILLIQFFNISYPGHIHMFRNSHMKEFITDKSVVHDGHPLNIGMRSIC